MLVCPPFVNFNAISSRIITGLAKCGARILASDAFKIKHIDLRNFSWV